MKEALKLNWIKEPNYNYKHRFTLEDLSTPIIHKNPELFGSFTFIEVMINSIRNILLNLLKNGTFLVLVVLNRKIFLKI